MINLDDKLIKGGWVKPEQLLKAKEEQIKSKKSLLCSLIKMGYMSEADVFKFFALNIKIPLVKLSDYQIKKEALDLLREDFCRENLVVPLFKIDFTLFVAMVNPLDTELIIAISNNTGLDIYPLLASPGDIIKTINDYFGYPDTFFAIENLAFEPQKLSHFPFYRASGRHNVSIPVTLRVEDKYLSLSSNMPLPAVILDISGDAIALGIKTKIFLPERTKISLNLSQDLENNLNINTEVIHCRMERPDEFLMGLKVLTLDENIINYLKSLAKH